jgi:hypothetical protein
MKKAIIVAMLGIVMLPAVASAKTHKDKEHTVVAAKSHPFLKFIVGK